MKAVIMAGGYGTRLRPLTDTLPKPMMNIIDKPIVSYIVSLLEKHGITEIAVTLGYKPQAIMNYFGDGSAYGVSMRYYIEDTPLGTAGSVKNVGEFLDGTFLVISGDAFTDIDLSEMTRAHRASGNLITMAVKYVDDVTGFGVVKTDRDNKITSFIEKPAFSEDHLVNTGIYLIEKEALDLIPQGKYDFSKDLFPRVLSQMGVYETEGYWSDIGTLSSYYLTNNDVARNLTRFGINF